jgi:hypothetical protein
LSAQLLLSRNWVNGYQKTPTRNAVLASLSPISPYGTAFNQADVALLWQLPNRSGQLQLGVRNLADTRFQYTDPDPLNPRFSIGRIVYGAVKLLW